MNITAYNTTGNLINNSSIRIEDINAPLVVNGRNIIKELDEIQDILLLLKHDLYLESKYPKLREIKDEYKLALEKYKTFEALK